MEQEPIQSVIEQSEAKPPHYLFDTNCFYAVSNNLKRQRDLRNLEPRVSTSIMAPLEILKVSSVRKDFARRKATITALDAIGTNIIHEHPDSVVRRAFGLSPVENPLPIEKMIRALKLANSCTQAIKGVHDRKNREVIRIFPMAIKAWKDDLSASFTRAIVAGNEQMINLFLEQLKRLEPDISERTLKQVARELNARSSQREHARNNAILGLAARAGVFSVVELTDALRDGRTNELIERAKANYNGLVESYVTMYLSFQGVMSDGRTPERNALFDLEFFTHLDAHGVEYVFVTTEDFWIELAKTNLRQRVVHLNSLFRN